ncbi:hypothetical protein [Candidatus Villigracilis saccharophilus]|nr:hypothetical protein [Anaerolineales bacterium]
MTTTARMVRSQTLAVKSRKFVLRARAIGSSKGTYYSSSHPAVGAVGI